MSQEIKKALITILGTSGTTYDHTIKSYKLANECEYKIGDKSVRQRNMLPILISEYGLEYEIEPLYTETAKQAQTLVLDAVEMSVKFDDDIGLLRDENDFEEIFSTIDRIMTKYDEVIVDVSHGFRHLPILMIIDVIIRGLSNSAKISKILFAKEIKRLEKYEVIDLKQYVDLASFAFVVTNFKDNFTISNHIDISAPKLQGLIKAMKDFSGDILSLSLEGLVTKSSKTLIKEIDNTINEFGTFSFTKDLEMLKSLISKSFTADGKKRYQSYYDIAKALFERGYYSNSLAILNEGIGLYVKSMAKQLFEDKINGIDNKIAKKELQKIYNFYTLSSTFKNMIIHESNFREELGFDGAQAQRLSDSIKEAMNEEKFKKFKKFISELTTARNDLLHANSTGKISDYKNKIEGFLKSYEEFCVDRKIEIIERPKIPKKAGFEIIKKKSEK
jgi:CRISPR-associated DxTHG motif protein